MISTVSTYSAGGVTARFGRDFPLDYGLPRVQPGVPGGFFSKPETGFHWHLFGGATGRLVVRNILLEGNTFEGGSEIDPRRYVADFDVSLVAAQLLWRVAYT